MKAQSRTKRGAQMRHARRRASERFGLSLTFNDLEILAKRIREGEATFVERQSGRQTVWDVLCNGIPVRVVYDAQRHVVVTFLYKNGRDHAYDPKALPAPLDVRDALSLYNALMGENPAADDLLRLLGLTKDAIPRYRDCWLEGSRIHLLTRTGGGNRADYLDAIDKLRRVKGFLLDFDDMFDPTFMHLVYEMPAGAIVKDNDAERGPGVLMSRLEKIKDSPTPILDQKLEQFRQNMVKSAHSFADRLSTVKSGDVILVDKDGNFT